MEPEDFDTETDAYEEYHRELEDQLPEDCERDWEEDHDYLLAQQELEDFEQADEYFGYFGDDF